ncbi:unnamed protein product [Orchesella dallaii]|uniref:Uncharacterized protein n=1 Tax=Orchesella dallaii TaxID=48710 RepID=A0ABP1R542_9HEXA
MWYSLSASIALLCIASAVHVQSLNLKTAKDQPCFNIAKPETPIWDKKWVTSINPIYFPVMSTDSLYRASLNVLQKEARDVSFATVYYDACIKWYINNNDTSLSTGFNGLRKEYKTETLMDNPDAFTFVGVGGDKDFYSGTLYTTLTDNKSFYFTAICMQNGEMVWAVGSTTPTLTEETKKKVFDHAVSLGFHKEDFTELKYDTCQN